MFGFLLLGCGLLVLQMTVFNELPLWELKIDGILLLIIYTSLYLSGPRSVILVFSLGILMDIFSGSALGMHVLVYVTLYVIVKLISRSFPVKESYYQQMPLIYFLSILAALGILTLNFLFLDGSISWDLVIIAALEAVLTAALSPVFFKFYNFLERHVGIREEYDAR